MRPSTEPRTHVNVGKTFQKQEPPKKKPRAESRDTSTLKPGDITTLSISTMQERLRKMPPKNSDLPGEQAVIPQILRISQAVLRRSVRQMTKELSAEDKKAYESLNNAANDIIFGNGDLSADSSGDSSGDNSADGSKDIPRGILSDNSDQLLLNPSKIPSCRISLRTWPGACAPLLLKFQERLQRPNSSAAASLSTLPARSSGATSLKAPVADWPPMPPTQDCVPSSSYLYSHPYAT